MAKGKWQKANGKWIVHLIFAFCLLIFAMPSVMADQVFMKDGTVYKGKIMIDTDKSILIGNPPFDPNSYLLESKDIEKIIYEEYHPNPPAERKRGLVLETRLGGDFSSSPDLSFSPSAGIYAGAGFRVHPLVEVDGGIAWNPAMHASDGFSVSNGTMTTSTTRQYEDFWMYSAVVSAKIFPFYQRPWKTEPYFTAGYVWSKLIPKDSGDSLKGSGWLIGFGGIRPLTTHLFLEARFQYQSASFDTVSFLGREGNVNPVIDEHTYSLQAGLSYRL